MKDQSDAFALERLVTFKNILQIEVRLLRHEGHWVILAGLLTENDLRQAAIFLRLQIL